MGYINKDDAMASIRRAIALAGSQAEFAKQVGVSRTYLNGVLHGRKEPTPEILAAVGLQREMMYRRLTA